MKTNYRLYAGTVRDMKYCGTYAFETPEEADDAAYEIAAGLNTKYISWYAEMVTIPISIPEADDADCICY